MATAGSTTGSAPGETIRALLITDVVDSTRLVEQLGDARAAALWAAHDRLARDLLRGFRGREIDKTDGLLLLFEDPHEAVRYAAAYHRAVGGLGVPLAARAALHVGPVVLRENSAADIALGAKPVEVDGLGKSIAARVMSIAGAGQTLLTAAAHEALDGAPGPAHSHGHWRLKGLSEPLEVFELPGPDGAFVPPEDAAKAYRVVRDGDLWRPARRIPHSLPAERDAFVGRGDALDDLARLFDAGTRLVTVTGMGGTGKTRLATRFGWSWLGDFPGGVWFCDLSQARSLDGVFAGVSLGLDVPLGREDAAVQLGHALAARGRCLVILDNFEQVMPHAEASVGRWLNRAAQAHFLVTSRNVLGVQGETVLPLAPMPTPDAAALFLRRAQAAKPDFRVHGDDADAVERLVHLLEGLPLAIELAAARVRVLSPRLLLARMSERFKLLASTRMRHGRQATLQATFDWSWELLSGTEKAALAQLSVFEGGFTMEAAEAVLDLPEDAPWTLDVLQSLVEKSLVRRARDERFELLVSMQAYASEHLRTPGRYPGSGTQAARDAEDRHARHFAGLSPQAATADRCIELENLVAACRRASAAGDAATATLALEHAWSALQLRGPFGLAVELAALVASMPGMEGRFAARAHAVEGRALQALGRVAEARRQFELALQEARAVDDVACEARVLCSLGNLDANGTRMDDARQRFTSALAMARRLADRALECEVLNGLGTLDNYLGRIEDARRHYELGLEIARAIGERRWEGGLLGNLGNLHCDAGRLKEAKAHYEMGLVVANELGNRTWEGNALCNLGLLHHAAGELTEAAGMLDHALQVARDIGHLRLEAVVLCNLGIVNESRSALETAQENYDAAVAASRQLGDARIEGQFLGYSGVLHGRRGRFDEARRRLERARRLLEDAGDAFNLGVVTCHSAEVELHAGDLPRGRALLQQAESAARELDVEPQSELAKGLARVRALLDTSD